MSSTFVFLGGAVLVLLLAGYFGQMYMPPPKPKIVGVDLGTTYSCIGMYHSVTGVIDILEVEDGHRCIPSVVAFSDEGVLVGYKAVAQAEHNHRNTLYDAKRFIGKKFGKQELEDVQKQYAFKLEADEYGMIRYVVTVNRTERRVTPEEVGSYIVGTLRQAAQQNLTVPVTKVVMSVPAEFDDSQRNYTRKAASIAGMEVLRVINEPTAAALAYGLHKKTGLHNVMVVDLGGGTLDVSLLNVQGGMFLTQAMAGNNHLGGQDFNQRLLAHLLTVVKERFGRPLTDRADIQALRLQVEDAKLNLTHHLHTQIHLPLTSFGGQQLLESISRTLFEDLNYDLFRKALQPIDRVLEVARLSRDEVDEIVLVGGSTRIPKVRQLIAEYFGKKPNTAIDPELAVVSGVSIQAGIMGGMWPLTVSAVELPTRVRKIQVH
ncbi:heat shock 70 kDa protein 13-like [Babylonia areolata]|uniref:heat shock 70 kDa protein 13-like n=1 Tax=Babylonia areolata TaxID=304850 RepID=UPI003FCF2549